MAAIAPPNEGGGGYDYQFVKTPSDMLVCTVCFLPSKLPHLTECCGHTFCKSCLEGSKKFSDICPICRSEKLFAMFNKQADRVIRSLHIFCTNKGRGCEWQGEVNDIANHLGNCLYQTVHCPNKCGKSLQRQHLTTHLNTECAHRRINCQYCSDVGVYHFIEGQHKEECSKFPVQCPNACGIGSICRDEVEAHTGTCPLEIVQCDYHVVGCKVKMTRKDTSTHKQEMMEVHLSLSITELMETKKELKLTQNNLKHEMEKTTDRAKKTEDRLTLQVWHTADTEQQLTACQQEAKRSREDLTQQLVQTEKRLTASQQEATKRTKDQLLQKVTATEKELKTTKQQLATTCQNLTKAEKEHTILAASTDRALTEMEAKFQAKTDEIVAAADKRIMELETKLQKAGLLERTLDPNPWTTSLEHRASKLASGDEAVPVVVKMSEFTKHKDTQWLSKPFYTNHNKECKLQLKIVANEVKLITYMSVSLIKYEHMGYVQPAERFKVRLLNQISDSKHHLGDPHSSAVMLKVFRSPAIVYQNRYFIVYEDLHKITATCQYLRDDTMFFEVLKSGIAAHTKHLIMDY